MNQSFLFLAEGFEEIEALTTVDVLRRAGLDVKTVSITSALQVKGAHGIVVRADVLFDNTLFDNPAWLILPGGLPGADNLYDFAPLHGLLEGQAKSANGRIAAICAAPAVVLGKIGLLKGEKATCYPGFEEHLEGAEYVDQPVVVSGKFVTANGPANSMLFALNIVRETIGELEAVKVANGMLFYPVSNEEFDFG
ncbi:MAG: DJ-1/PfpI family protein [Muribaculaceae bacterium]|nr:DJ-1/PfpI family protein [Muribaculaceae bacterium]MDE6294691.1 DJ-1/PfpI family protein [Muribaculaceae bacterium]